VLSGPSAVGKSTVVRCLRDRIPALYFSVSATTRHPRPGEWAEIHGGLQRSGTPAQPVRDALESGRPVLIEVDLAGARAIKQALPEAVTVFLAPPSWADLERRLAGRATESPAVMARRLATARAELAAQDDFDVVVVNRQLESACSELVSLLVGTAPNSV
jgi:guanylate kinase